MESRSLTVPPRVATWVLEATLPPAERDAVVGDLVEEFTTFVVPARGARSARWWYVCQVARSIAPFAVRAWERASVSRGTLALLSATVVTTLPAVLLVMLRSFVLQQVPLKTTSEASAAFAALLASVVLLAGVLGFAAAVVVLNPDSRQR